jgi:hypothetical protein
MKEISIDKTVIVVMAYDRPQFFEQVARSISKCRDFAINVFIDGGTPRENVVKHTEIIDRFIPWSVVTVRDTSCGCDLNILSALNEISERDYEAVVYLEDDTQICKNGPYLLLNALNFCREKSPHLQSVQLFNRNGFQGNQNELYYTKDNYWGGIHSRDAWLECKEDFTSYIKIYRQYGRLSMKMARFVRSLNCSPLPLAEDYRKFVYDNELDGWDHVFQKVFLKHGFMRLKTAVNRCKNIGSHGANYNEGSYMASNLWKLEIYETENDRSITKFCINEENNRLLTEKLT